MPSSSAPPLSTSLSFTSSFSTISSESSLPLCFALQQKPSTPPLPLTLSSAVKLNQLVDCQSTILNRSANGVINKKDITGNKGNCNNDKVNIQNGYESMLDISMRLPNANITSLIASHSSNSTTQSTTANKAVPNTVKNIAGNKTNAQTTKPLTATTQLNQTITLSSSTNSRTISTPMITRSSTSKALKRSRYPVSPFNHSLIALTSLSSTSQSSSLSSSPLSSLPSTPQSTHIGSCKVLAYFKNSTAGKMFAYDFFFH